MALTLGQLRTFCAEHASPDSSGETADREFMEWINAALARVFGEQDWDRILFEEKLTILPPETGDDLIVTQGSLALERTSALFPAKYVDDRWALFIQDEPRIEFELAAVDDTLFTATLRAGDEWIGASGVDQTYTFFPNKLAIPQALEVKLVQVVATGHEVQVLTPADYDRLRMVNPANAGAEPTHCTFRRGRLEFWPHPGSYSKLTVTYRKAHNTPFLTTDDDDLDCGWDEALKHVLQKAIMLEAAGSLGEDAVVDYQTALQEYVLTVNNAKDNSEKRFASGPMGVQVPLRGRYPHKVSHVGEVTDA